MNTVTIKNDVTTEENIKIDKRAKLIGYYDYSVILTYIGMLTAFFGIIKSVSGDFKKAVICLMVSGICDMFDGAVAATKNRTREEKNYGIQIDSLSDVISFGVFPAVLLYSLNSSRLNIVIGGLYVLCALIRLAYFNVTEEVRQDTENNPRKYYAGLPVTTSAIVLPLVYILFFKHIVRSTSAFSVILLIMSVAFIVPVSIRKPQKYGKVVLLIIGCTEFALLLLGVM